ncbi:hypothetical protein R6Q57_016518 [Mikania cordata]
MLLVILLILFQTGTTDLQIILTTKFSERRQIFLWIAFFSSFAVKVPMVPVHIWLPEAHVEAPTAGSVILAGILLKLGTYGFLRFSIPMLPEATLSFTPFIYTLSTIAIIYTSLTTLRQIHLKKIIAYSLVAHMNLVTIDRYQQRTGQFISKFHIQKSRLSFANQTRNVLLIDSRPGNTFYIIEGKARKANSNDSEVLFPPSKSEINDHSKQPLNAPPFDEILESITNQLIHLLESKERKLPTEWSMPDLVRAVNGEDFSILVRFMTYKPMQLIVGIRGILLNRRNIPIMSMPIESTLLAMNSNFLVFSVSSDDMMGQSFASLVPMVAAAESAIGLAIFVITFRFRGTIAVESINRIQESLPMARSAPKCEKTVQALLCLNLNVKSATLPNATSSRHFRFQDDLVTGFHFSMSERFVPGSTLKASIHSNRDTCPTETEFVT